MKRIIKFRAWDEGLNEMQYFDLLDIEHLDYQLLTEYLEQGLVMQFCCLLDKNEKEIYEGDIVYSPFYESNLEVVWPEKYITGDNEDIMTWCVANYAKGLGLFDLDVQFTWEVIGNIYENPELLEKKV